jgi:hypothetical protein
MPTDSPHTVSPAIEHAELADSAPPPTVSRAFGHTELADAARRTDAGGPVPDRAGSDALAERQAALVAALVAGAPDPAGFDPARLAAARRALLRKRAGEAAGAWPLLAASLGNLWASTFAAHHAGRPPGGALRAGWDLARALRGELTPDAAAELAVRETILHYDGKRAPCRRRLRRARLALARLTRLRGV